MKVKAKQLGFYGLKRRREGDVFFLNDEKHFSDRWMEKLESKKKAAPKKKAAKKVEVDEPEEASLDVI